MAKNFPYFKFIVTEWLTGDIVYEEFSVQGLFINVCALYWQRDGSLTVEDVNKRYKNPVELELLIDNFLLVTDGVISIKFLDEQLIDAKHISKVNSKNGSLGGRPKKSEIKPTANRQLTDDKAKKSKEEKEEEQEINKNKKKIPEYAEFLAYAIEQDKTIDINSVSLKYKAWVQNDWKDGFDKKITNWKSKLLNTLPHLKKNLFNGQKPKYDSPA